MLQIKLPSTIGLDHHNHHQQRFLVTLSSSGNTYSKKEEEEEVKGSQVKHSVVDYLVVIINPNQVYCIEAVCPHSGGPLHEGDLIIADIEDLKSSSTSSSNCSHPKIMCPWHSFQYSLINGSSEDDDEEQRHAIVVSARLAEDGETLVLDVDESIWTVDIVKHIQHPSGNDQPQQEQLIIVEEPALPAKTLVDWCIRILNEPRSLEKVRLAHFVWDEWNAGNIQDIGWGVPPASPARQANIVNVAPSKMPKSGRGGTLESRQAIIHALANIELWAIDLAFDIMARFSQFTVTSPSSGETQSLPREFFNDFLKVANDEARHFDFLVDRLSALGMEFGALPVHGSLWESATNTKDSLVDRLAIVHMVHEARGLDVNPGTIAKFQKVADNETVERLLEIHNDEVTHVSAGQRWFTWCCQIKEIDRYTTFHEIVRRSFRGPLKPPFNDADRLRAGLDPEFYIPLKD